MAIIANGKTIPTTEGSIIANNVKITKVNVVRNGVTTTVWTSAHVHTDACYEWAGYGLCGGCNYEYSGPFDNHVLASCPNCGLYQIDEKKITTCGY